MFSLLKYFYGSPKIEIIRTLIDEEPEIIDSYSDILEIIEKSEEEENKELENKWIDTNNGCITENILKRLKNDKFASKNKDLMYLVLSKNTREPLGIYNSLDKAKKYGQKATYFNCSILSFNVNDNCKYLTNPIFEDK